MKRATTSTLILVTAAHIARADFDGGVRACKTAMRPVGASTTEAVRAALALDGKAGAVWVLCEDVFTQSVSLSPAQVAGLTQEQLGRALSFEVEPFSGIPVAESATGFHRSSEGVFDVIELPRADRDAIQCAAADAGGKLAGIAHPGPVPDEGEFPGWLAEILPQLQSGALPLITPPAPAPSPHRFLVAAVALEAAALFILFISAGWMIFQRRGFERRNPHFVLASRELEAANKQIAALKTELAALDKEQVQRDHIVARRGSLHALLHGLAATRLEDIVVRGIQSEGPSSLVVSGLSLEAGAVDEMSIILTQNLRAAGWTAQPRSKTGKRNLPSGGPWEFSLAITHEEAARVQAIQLTQRGGE